MQNICYHLMYNSLKRGLRINFAFFIENEKAVFCNDSLTCENIFDFLLIKSMITTYYCVFIINTLFNLLL